MTSETELEAARNETFRKIGRNLANFQRMEQMLKCLIANGTIAGYASELSANRERQAEVVHTTTMGGLAGRFFKELLITGDAPDDDPGPLEVKEPWFRFAFRIETDPANHEARKRALAAIVADRNDLAHHFLDNFDLDSLAGCRAADRYLDQQRENALPEFELLKGDVQAFAEAREVVVGLLGSDEYKKWIQSEWFRHTRLVDLLTQIPTQARRPDGWTSLDRAGQLLRQQAPEDIAALQEQYGHKTLKALKALSVATELFDLYEETTAKGGMRVLYRLKSDGMATNA